MNDPEFARMDTHACWLAGAEAGLDGYVSMDQEASCKLFRLLGRRGAAVWLWSECEYSGTPDWQVVPCHLTDSGTWRDMYLKDVGPCSHEQAKAECVAHEWRPVGAMIERNVCR
jgi:hypothetical protein